MVKTFEQFVNDKKNRRKTAISDKLAEELMPRPKGEPRKTFAKKVNVFKCTHEFQDKLKERCGKDAVYQLLDDPDKVALDETLQAEYEKYVFQEEINAMGDQWQDRVSGFLEYIVEREGMLLPLAQQIAEEEAEAEKNYLRTEKLSIVEPDYDYPYYWHRTKSIAVTIDNFDEFIDYFKHNARDLDWEIQFIEDVGPLDQILDYLAENDCERFETEKAKLAEGFSRFTEKHLAGALSDQFYDSCLYDDLTGFYETMIYNNLYDMDADEIENLLRENPHYRNQFKKQEEEERREKEKQKILEQGILDHIPANPIDLYPLARKMHRKWVLHIGPTNSGKTYTALQALKAAPSGVYLGPLRLLAFECFECLNGEGVPCSLVTGEEEREVEGAMHTASTIEILDTTKPYDVAVIDEAQMVCDTQRGGAWTAALLGVRAQEIHICAAPQAEAILVKLAGLCGDEVSVVRHERTTPLVVEEQRFNDGILKKSVRKHDALIAFSKWKVLAVAADLQSRGIKCSVIYGALPYEVRQNEAKRFASGETDVVVATDAIGMGLNLPIQRVVFLEQKKFDGKEDRLLTAEEIRQIGGRAGRKGIYEKGYVSTSYKQKMLRMAFTTKQATLQYAYLGFAKNLIGVDGKLSEIMEKWLNMESSGIFRKVDLEEQLELCRILEAYSDDKELIYQFILIPFDIKKEALKTVWLSAFRKELKGEHLLFVPPKYDTDLDSMEGAYKYCDLMYYYLRRFSVKDQLPEILACKTEITEKINKLLADRKIPGKTCKYCGKKLPWNYPYGMCEKCHSEMYSRRYNWDDDYEE